MGFGYQYDPAGTVCTGGPMPGTVALAELCRARWPELTDLGIYNCRAVRGGSSLSLHGEGRAADLGTPSPQATEQGHECAAWLVANAEALGVQEVIWHRRRWASNTRAWRSYGGLDPHTSHVHVGLCRAAAAAGQLPAAALAGAEAGRGGGLLGPLRLLLDGATWRRLVLVLVGLVALGGAVALVVTDRAF